jgi:hypothetical protein
LKLTAALFKEGLFGKPYWIDGDQLPGYLQRLNPNNLLLCSHNFLFDGCIFAWRYNFVPKLACCTLSVSRANIKL